MASAGRGLGSKMFLNDPKRSKPGLGACLEAVQPPRALTQFRAENRFTLFLELL